MRITNDQVIAGLPAIKARQLMRRLGEYITPHRVREIVGCRDDRANMIVARLQAAGFIKAVGSYWEPTVKGCALCGAKASQPLRRATAERLIQQVLERAHALNSDDTWAYCVETIAVFGSYIEGKERPNDVDIACELRPRWTDAKKQRAHEETRRTIRRNFANMSELAFWPRTEVLSFLKARSRGLSVHQFDSWIRQNTHFEVLFAEKGQVSVTRPIEHSAVNRRVVGSSPT
jgi:predicted nucleotidyltransferase